eukprot:Em0007g1444a
MTCLDKTWHKACFSCESCGLKLTMKTYKGYNKLPYCATHYPTTKFTQVADTPESRRIADQQKLSEIEYRKDKVESLKQFTPVASDVGTRQAQAASKLASSAAYTQREEEEPEPAPAPIRQPPPMAAQPPQPMVQQQPPAPKMAAAPAPKMVAAPAKAAAPPPSTPRYVALYDYTKNDEDEVSFVEGDVIIDASIIDDGWMEGRVERTSQYGMLPSNYVQKM